ncbi:MAG: DUF1161 domain-containing protein [Betaproteobacteria bacterium]|nr:DUF1161 domain-containing protein [Betaproteobacteria bacterium]
MKHLITLLALTLLTTPAFAKKPCEELKSEIEAKLTAKGVKGATLTIVASKETKEDSSKGEKVVGTCDGDASKIIYSRSSGQK